MEPCNFPLARHPEKVFTPLEYEIKDTVRGLSTFDMVPHAVQYIKMLRKDATVVLPKKGNCQNSWCFPFFLH